MGRKALLVRVSLALMVKFTVFAALLYASAGTVVWPAGWVFLAIFFGGGMTVVLLLARNDPECVAARRERIAC